MTPDITKLKSKVNEYKLVLENTNNYRLAWKNNLKLLISNTLNSIISQTELKAKVVERNNIENLEALVLDLGRSSSGISENMEHIDLKHTMIKNNGALIYQQLFNGKIMVMILSPHIEGYGEQKEPESLEIIRPDEISEASILEHVENLLDTIIFWEDYDDEDPKKQMPFQPIGFQHSGNIN
jgi:hypothetical protein